MKTTTTHSNDSCEHTPTGCIEWIGAIDCYGYGRKQTSGKWKLAHRLVYEQKHGKIPAGMVIDHLCRNRKCVNTEHMEVVTPAENTRRGNGITVINSKKTHCKHGHELSGDNLLNGYLDRRQCRECGKRRVRAYAAKKQLSLAKAQGEQNNE